MSAETKHTPTPWRVSRHERDACMYVDSDDTVMGGVAALWGGQVGGVETAEANAEIIVRAVNHHAALLAMLKRQTHESERYCHGCQALCREARTLIAKVEGREP